MAISPLKNGSIKFDFFANFRPWLSQTWVRALAYLQGYSPHTQLHTAYRHYPGTAWVRPEICTKGRCVRFCHYQPRITGRGGKMAKLIDLPIGRQIIHQSIRLGELSPLQLTAKLCLQQFGKRFKKMRFSRE